MPTYSASVNRLTNESFESLRGGIDQSSEK